MTVGRWLAAAVFKNIIAFRSGRRGADPYRILLLSLIFACRGGVPPPAKLVQNKREAKRLPYRRDIKICTKFVEDDILGVPFVRRNVTFGSLREGAPARAGGGACETKGDALILK